MAAEVVEEKDRVSELEAQVASLTKQNTKLKNELRFTTDSERRKSGEYIAQLQRELETLHARNQQISGSLMIAESQLQNSEASQAKVEAAGSARMAAHSAALVERLSSAQREKERLLASQLRKVMDEKAQLLKMLKDKGEDVNSFEQHEQEADETNTPGEKNDLIPLVEALQTATTAFELQQGGDKIVKRLREMQEKKRNSIQSKIDMLKQESLEALRKQEAEEKQVRRLKRQLEMLKTEYKLVDKTRIKALQAQLQTAISERDGWQKRAEKFEDTCETLRVLSSLQKSMSKEDDIKRKYESELTKYQEDVELLNKQSHQLLLERNQVVQERNQLAQERSQLMRQVQTEYERAERLQRMVMMLRRKVANNSATSSSDRSEIHTQNQVYDI